MIYRFEIFFRAIRRWLSRSEWLSRLLNLSKTTDAAVSTGLVIIQIDGLSHTQLERALEKGSMPFLRKILKEEHYRLHAHYSGMPSSTPAVQGELFYGIKCAVSAFSFMDQEKGEVVRMFDPGPVAEIECALVRAGEPLLKGGSTYSNIFTGGADESESHFCPASLGWGAILRTANPVVMAFLVISNFYSFIRTAVLLVVEFFVAIDDFISGLIAGHDFFKELKFIPTRVGICILLRELVTIGAKIDVTRGLPIIHINFLGYDEQSHRRGPSSKFAHWTLKGIDDAIARIWRAAKRSTRRNYDVWIYSDHGQEKTLPYLKIEGRTIGEAVAEVFGRLENIHTAVHADNFRGIQSQRVKFLGGERIQLLFPVYREGKQRPGKTQVTVTAMGPLGLVYYSRKLTLTERERIARELVNSAKVPLVLVSDGPGKARAWTEEGEFPLPDQSAQILGSNHPFLKEVTQDLIHLCHHANAGDFVICGWRKGIAAYSFALENGSHAGPTPEETKAFALLPEDTRLPNNERNYLRPLDLRHAALSALNRAEAEIPREFTRKVTEAKTLRIMTYNVHSCLGMDGKISPERIARVIAQHNPDIVALQELDVGRSRTGGVDQAHIIAQYLQMKFHFHPTVRIEEELYGDAVLTHLPMRLVKSDKLPGLFEKPHLEPRGALWVAIEVNGSEIQFINTHLGLRPKERLAQTEALLGTEWLSHPDCREPLILTGDFNAMPSSPVCLRLRNRLNDAQIELANHRPRKTLFGRYPLARIDHIFVDPGIEVIDVKVPNTKLEQVASDHLPLLADIRLG